MSLFPQTKTVQTLLTTGGATPSIGGQPVRVTIPRQSRRLQKIRIHARFNVTTALEFPCGTELESHQKTLSGRFIAGILRNQAGFRQQRQPWLDHFGIFTAPRAWYAPGT